MRLVLSAGEASGDAYGAALLHELRSLGYEGDIQAIGGARMQEAGATLVADSRSWGSIGVYEALKSVPKAASGYIALRTLLSQGEPGVFVPIDFGWANVRLSRVARHRGWKVAYFIPPGSWRREMNPGELPSITDVVICPFPWNVERLEAAGATARFFGHPLKSLLADAQTSNVERRGIAVLPGSRKQEVDGNVKEIARGIESFGFPVNIGVAASIGKEALEKKWRKVSRLSATFYSSAASALLASEIGVVCSGTATLEAALCSCPCVVVYRGSRMLRMEASLSGRKLKYVSLPNLILNQRVVPELLIEEANAARIREEVERLLTGKEARETQLEAFSEIDALLGPSDAIHRSAELIQGLIAKQGTNV